MAFKFHSLVIFTLRKALKGFLNSHTKISFRKIFMNFIIVLQGGTKVSTMKQIGIFVPNLGRQRGVVSNEAPTLHTYGKAY